MKKKLLLFLSIIDGEEKVFYLLKFWCGGGVRVRCCGFCLLCRESFLGMSYLGEVVLGV